MNIMFQLKKEYCTMLSYHNCYFSHSGEILINIVGFGNNTENVLIGYIISIACEELKVGYYIHRKNKYISINSLGCSEK